MRFPALLEGTGQAQDIGRILRHFEKTTMNVWLQGMI